MNWRKLSVFCVLAAGIALSPHVRGGSDYVERNSGIPPFELMVRNPLSLAQALNIAAAQNSTIKAARSDVEARFGIAIQVRAIVLPKALNDVGYAVVQDSVIESNENSTAGPLINNQSWSSD